MASFADLKKNRENKFAELQEAAKEKKGFVNHDAKCWRPTLDKAGSGYAIIRFLPAPNFLSEDESDWQKVESFNVKRFHQGNPKPQYYLENSLRTLGKEDPANDLKWEFWNKGDEESKNLSRAIKQRTQYYANVYVIKDQNAPQNEGKVVPYRFGQQIFEKVQNALTPEFEMDPRFNPFDMWEGRNFIVKVTTDPAKKLPDYSKSAFDAMESELFPGDDDRKEQVWRSAESVKQWAGDDRFKTFDELKKKIYAVMEVPFNEGSTAPSQGQATSSRFETRNVDPTPKAETRPEPEQSRPEPQAEETSGYDNSALDDDDEFLKQFGGDFES